MIILFALFLCLLTLIYYNFNKSNGFLEKAFGTKITSDSLIKSKFENELKLNSLIVEAEDLITYCDKKLYGESTAMAVVEFKLPIGCKILDIQTEKSNIVLKLSKPQFGEYEYKIKNDFGGWKEKEGIFVKLPDNLESKLVSEVVEQYKKEKQDDLFEKCINNNELILEKFLADNFPKYNYKIKYE